MNAMLSALLCACVACAASAQQPAAAPAPVAPKGAVQQGTFASELLQHDTWTGVQAAAAKDCSQPQGITPFVMRAPAGPDHARSWDEVWVLQCAGGASLEVPVHFQETADGGADYSIRTGDMVLHAP